MQQMRDTCREFLEREIAGYLLLRQRERLPRDNDNDIDGQTKTLTAGEAAAALEEELSGLGQSCYMANFQALRSFLPMSRAWAGQWQPTERGRRPASCG